MDQVNKVPSHLIEIGESFEQKFKPVLTFDSWRLAFLKYSDATEKNNFHQVERHNETYEVFILTKGKAELIICENGDKPGEPYIFEMKLNVAYNIPPSVWHHVILSKDAHIVIFEKENTTRENSNYYSFDNERKNELLKLFSDF